LNGSPYRALAGPAYNLAKGPRRIASVAEYVIVYCHETHDYDGAVYVCSNGTILAGPEGAQPWECERLRQYPNSRGYLLVTLRHSGTSRSHLVSRLVCAAFHGQPPAGCHAHHRSGDRRDNSARNLIWLEPQRHKIEHKGGLDAEQVRAIRACYSEGGVTQAQLAVQYGVSAPAIAKAVRGETWAEAGGPLSKAPRGARKCRGSANGAARLSERQVRDIRSRHRQGESVSSIAQNLDLPWSTVSAVVRRQTWSHIPD